MQRVYEFDKVGGATLDGPDGFEKAGQVFKNPPEDKTIVIVPSAVGGMTNHLRKAFDLWEGKGNPSELLDQFKMKHVDIISKIFKPVYRAPVERIFFGFFNSGIPMSRAFKNKSSDVACASILALGEDVSAAIFKEYLSREIFGSKIGVALVDARRMIWTDNGFVNASLNHGLSRQKTKFVLDQIPPEYRVIVTPGFIGSDFDTGKTSNLEREGSDITVAIEAEAMLAKLVTFWKRVSGVVTDDGKLVPRMTYAQFMTWLMAQIVIESAKPAGERKPALIHPDAARILLRARIPFVIRSSYHLECPGTRVS